MFCAAVSTKEPAPSSSSDQYQDSLPASPEILHHTVWRTWLPVAYPDKRCLYYRNSHCITYTFLFKPHAGHDALRASLVRCHPLCESKSWRVRRAIRFHPLFSRLICVAFWLKYLVFPILCQFAKGLVSLARLYLNCGGKDIPSLQSIFSIKLITSYRDSPIFVIRASSTIFFIPGYYAYIVLQYLKYIYIQYIQYI